MKKTFIVIQFLFFILFLLYSKSNNYAYVTSKSGLVLRSSATTKSKKITVIPNNSKVEIINGNGPRDTIYGISSHWYKIKYRNKIGWVFGGFLRMQSQKREENKNEIDNIIQITGKYKFNYGKFSPVLILNRDNSFSMTLNVCTGMLKVDGKYKYENDIVTVEVRNCKDCFGFAGIKGMVIKFKRISNNKLVVENEVYRMQDGQKFGFCAPNKGDVFRK